MILLIQSMQFRDKRFFGPLLAVRQFDSGLLKRLDYLLQVKFALIKYGFKRITKLYLIFIRLDTTSLPNYIKESITGCFNVASTRLYIDM